MLNNQSELLITFMHLVWNMSFLYVCIIIAIVLCSIVTQKLAVNYSIPKE